MTTIFALQKEYEINLRGTTLTISALFEQRLMHLIIFSHVQHLYKPEESPTLKIKKLTFGGKLSRVKDLLALHHADLLAKYESVITSLDEFKKLRDKVAHCKITWQGNDFEELEIWDVVEDGKLQITTPEKYSRTGLAMQLMEFTKAVDEPMLNLQIEVQERFQRSDPSLFAALLAANEGQI